MTSVLGEFSQIPPLKRYIVGPDASGYMFSIVDGVPAVPDDLAANSVLLDMGKTVQAGTYLMRKVKLVTDVGDDDYGVGYISLDTNSVTVSATPYLQNISRLN